MQKRILAIIMALAMVIMACPLTVFAATGDVTINETNFKDANFRQYVKENFDKDGNDVLSAKEIKAAEIIDLSSESDTPVGTVSDLTGIQYFTNLQALSFSENNVSSVDLSKNVELVILDCSYNNLSTLDISKNVNLMMLDCSNNNLTKLDISKCPELGIISCTNNNIKTLNFTNSIVFFDCDPTVNVNIAISTTVKLKRVSGTKSDGTAYFGKAKLTWDELFWDDPDYEVCADEYEVWRSTEKNGTYKKIGTTTNTSYTNSGTDCATTYYYKVRGVFFNYMYDDDGNESVVKCYSKFSPVVGFTTSCATPSVSISRVDGTKSDGTKYYGKPKLSWKAVPGASKYEVYRSTSKNGTYSLLGTTTGTSYTNSGAAAGKTYYYKVKAINGTSSYAFSDFSSPKGFTPTLNAPEISVSVVNGKPKVTWKAVTGAKEYEVYRSTSKTGTYKKLGTTTKLSYHNTGAPAGTYYYKVKAIKSAGHAANSTFSNIKSVKAK